MNNVIVKRCKEVKRVSQDTVRVYLYERGRGDLGSFRTLLDDEHRDT